MYNTSTQCASICKALEHYELTPCWWVSLMKDVFSVLGLIGNLVLSRVRMQSHLRNVFNKLLVALAVFDSFTLALPNQCLLEVLLRNYSALLLLRVSQRHNIIISFLVQ